MKLTTRAAGLCLLIAVTFPLWAHSARQTQSDTIDAAVDSYVAREIERQRIPGLSLGVIRDGQLIKAKGYGLANVELDVAVKPESVFQTGSVGKQFTSMAVMMLVEEGKIHLDDKVSLYFAKTPASWKNITVRHLLTHTSGVHDYESDNGVKKDSLINLRQDYSEDELYQKIITMPLDFQPGSRWQYSNVGYELLGFLIRKVTGQFYGDFLHDRVFQPLGMNATRIISEEDLVMNRCAGYRLVDGVLKNQEWVAPMQNTTADGSLYTDVPDMAKWDAALYTERLLKKSSFDQTWTPVKLNNGKTYPYGFGWDINEANGHKLIEHSGAWQGFTSQFSRYVDDKLTVVVLTNLDSDHSDPTVIAHQVAAFYVPALAPRALAPMEDRDPQQTAQTRKIVEQIAAGAADPNAFSRELRAELFPDGVTEARKKLDAAGPLKSFTLVGVERETSPEGDLTDVRAYRAEFEHATFIVRSAPDTKGKFSEFSIGKE